MIHPGEELQKRLSLCNMTRKELALRTGVTEKHICTVINGDRDISAVFAKKLGYVFESASYWLNLQAKYDEEQLSIKEQNSITQDEINILKPLHDIIMYFIERGYIHNNCSDILKVIQLRDLLQISDLTQIPKITYNAAYRAQLSTNIKIDPYVLFAWQRLCEIEAEKIEVNKPLDKQKLRRYLDEIKSMMFGDINDGIHKLQNLFAECGIAFQVVKNFRGAPVQGFIKETSDKKIILCLTIRGKRADSFWFTLFHEIWHIFDDDYSARFIDFDSVSGKQEELADRFARDKLIPPEKYKIFIRSANCTLWSNIERFARTINVEPFIVLGRLQNDGYLDWSDYPEHIVRYSWA